MDETMRTQSIDTLSERELDVLRLLSQGLANRQIAAALALSEHTVKLHLVSIFAKLSVSNRTQAVAVAVRRGMIALDT
jgi:two-component system, NarL family, response regulator